MHFCERLFPLNLSLYDNSIICNRFKDLPEELKKKVRKAKVDLDKANEHFEVLCNVLRFTTKRHVVKGFGEHETKENDKEKENEKHHHDSSESNLPPWMIKEAGKSFISFFL